MKTAHVPKYVVGGLAAVILLGLVVWLIRSEGQRARQAIRDSRGDAQSPPKAVPPDAQGDNTRPSGMSKPSSDPRETTPAASERDQPKPAIVPATDPKPAVAESKPPAEENFSLDDHVVFPGLADEVSKPKRAKTRVDPASGH